MKKTAIIAPAMLLLMLPVTADAAYSQYDIYTAARSALSWQETNADPRNFAGSFAADYFIMSMSRMNMDYDFSSYSRLIEKINPSTKQDGQRLIMTMSACGTSLNENFVAWYTYTDSFDNASDLAGAIITLKSGGYNVNSEETSLDDMYVNLLKMQQSNGSFGNDIPATAKSVIALSHQANVEYRFNGDNPGEVYTYNVNSAISNACSYLSQNQQNDGGYSTVANTAYVIAALDSIGIDADNNSEFIKDGHSPLSYIISAQDSSGCVNGSVDDTAIASTALVSHLRAMQGISQFFDFISGDTVSAVSQASDSTNQSGNSVATMDSPSVVVTGNKNPPTTAPSPSSSASPASPAAATPGPTKAPEHSAVSEEEYGPFQFVGPIQQTAKPEKATAAPVAEDGTPKEKPQPGTVAMIAAGIIAALALSGFVALTIINKNPKMKAKLETALNNLKSIKDKADTESAPKSENETDLIKNIDDKVEIVSEEELYNPDFIKKLIPVDSIDDSINSLIPPEDD